MVLHPVGDGIRPVPTGSTVQVSDGRTYEVREPSYLVTMDYMIEIMRVRVEEETK